jgi:parallel beta-helix repeat protein
MLAALCGIINAASLVAGTAISEAASSDTSCPPTINSCGCVITAPGAYKVGLALDSTQGSTSANECIGIGSSFVTLDVAKKTITGPGTQSPGAIGIGVRRNVKTFVLEGRGALITAWDIGLSIQGRSGVIDNFNANSNETAGVELVKAKSNTLSNVTASSNQNYGIWLQQSGGNQLTNLKTQSNGNIGVYVGCSDLGPISASCPGVGASAANYIFTGNVAANTNYGIALDIGANNAIVTNNTLGGGAHNSKNDFFDANSNCGSNQWFANDSTATVSQTCIK